MGITLKYFILSGLLALNCILSGILCFWVKTANAGQQDKVQVAWTANQQTRTSYKILPFSYQLRSACVTAGVVAATHDEFLLYDPFTGAIRAHLPLPYESENWTASGDYIVYARRDWDRRRTLFGAVSIKDMSRPAWQSEFAGRGGGSDIEIIQTDKQAIWAPYTFDVNPMATTLFDIRSGSVVATHKHRDPAPYFQDHRRKPAQAGHYLLMPVVEFGTRQERFEVVDLEHPEKLNTWRPDIPENFQVVGPDATAIGGSKVVVQYSIKGKRPVFTSHLVAIDLSDKKTVWRLDVSKISARKDYPIAVTLNDKQIAFLLDEGKKIALVDSSNGEIVNVAPLNGLELIHYNMTWNINGRLVTGVRKISDNGKKTVGIAAIDPKNGTLDWFLPTGEKSKLSDADGYPISVSAGFGHLYVSMLDGRLLALKGEGIDALLKRRIE